MVLAWYMNSNGLSERHQEHHRVPHQYVTLEDLYKLTGVEYFYINNIESLNEDPTLQYIRESRGYIHERHLTCSKDFLQHQYEEKLDQFYTEHIHEEEILLVIGGSGYFDVRDLQDNWIRVHAVQGDMIVFPAGIYHRFTLDMKKYLKAVSFSTNKPVLTAYKRPADDMEFRKHYLQDMATRTTNVCM